MSRDRGQSTLFAVVAGLVIMCAMAILGMLLVFLGGQVLVPMFDSAVATSDAAQNEGFVAPAYDTLELGLGLALPLTIAVPTIVWFLFLRLRTDVGPGFRR